MPSINIGLTWNAETAAALMMSMFLVISLMFIYLLDRSAPPGAHKIFGKNED